MSSMITRSTNNSSEGFVETKHDEWFDHVILGESCKYFEGIELNNKDNKIPIYISFPFYSNSKQKALIKVAWANEDENDTYEIMELSKLLQLKEPYLCEYCLFVRDSLTGNDIISTFIKDVLNKYNKQTESVTFSLVL